MKNDNKKVYGCKMNSKEINSILLAVVYIMGYKEILAPIKDKGLKKYVVDGIDNIIGILLDIINKYGGSNED